MHWFLMFIDGRVITDEDHYWPEVSDPVLIANETHYVTREPASQLSLSLGGHMYTVRAPDQQTHFFRFTRWRKALTGGDPQVAYYVIGSLSRNYRYWLEIDARGHATARIDHDA